MVEFIYVDMLKYIWLVGMYIFSCYISIQKRGNFKVTSFFIDINIL